MGRTIRLILLLAATSQTGAQAAPPLGALTAAEVKAQVVGHSVAYADGSATWWYRPNGRFEADDGRTGQEGTYVVGVDGRLCWKQSNGIAGCFLFVRKGKALIQRRADSGHDFELGAVTLGPL